MPSPLARRLERVESTIGAGSSGPALLVVGSWDDFGEMRRQLAAGAVPTIWRTLPLPPDSIMSGEADEAERAAWDTECRQHALGSLAAAPPLPADASPLSRGVREMLSRAILAGEPRPRFNPFVPGDHGEPARVLDPSEHAGAVAVTEGFAAEWERAWASEERYLSGPIRNWYPPGPAWRRSTR